MAGIVFLILQLLTWSVFIYIFMVMKCFGSNRLTMDEKAVLIMANGREISQCIYSDIRITLYRLKEDFIEVWQDMRSIKVMKVENVKNKSINPYLKYLDFCNLN